MRSRAGGGVAISAASAAISIPAISAASTAISTPAISATAAAISTPAISAAAAAISTPAPCPTHIVAGPMTDGAVDITVGFGSVTRNFTSLAVAFSVQLRVFRLLLRMPSTAASLTSFSARQRGTLASL